MIASVLKALDILDTFSPSEPRLSLAEISRRLGLPRSTTHNLIKTLVSRGYMEKVSSDQFALGPTVIALTQAVRVNVELRDRAAPLLRELADICRESVYLTIPDGDLVLYIYAVESPRRLLARSAVGDRFCYHCTSVGKAMLAWMPPDQVEGIVRRVGLPTFTEATITDAEVLRQELELTRRRGYACDAGENNPHIHCVAAPIFNAQGAVIGACSVSGADEQILGNRLPDLSQRVMATAEEISRRMGFVPSSPSAAAPAALDAARLGHAQNLSNGSRRA
jgi:DNA-binding IclR family transcriptional regulator